MPGPTTNPTQPVGNRHNRSQHKISVPEKQRNPPPGLPEKPLARPAPKSGPKNEQQSSAPVQQPKPAAGFSIDSLRSLSGKSVEQKEQMPGSVARAQFRQADASVSAQLPGGDAVSTAVAALGGVVQALERRSLSTLERRKLAESSARIGTLQTATGADEERLAALTREVASGSFAAAKQRHAEMAAADKDGRQREWLSAVNTLLLIARRHQGSE